jgi:hypothetical protein
MIPARDGAPWRLPPALRAGLIALGEELDPDDRIRPRDLVPGTCLKCLREIWIWHAARPAIPFEVWDRRDGASYLRIHSCWLQSRKEEDRR